MNKQETITDIITEMLGARTEFPFVYLMGEPDTPEVIDCVTKEIIEPHKINIRRVTVKELADRLEAAHGREVDKLNSVIQATFSRSDAEIDRLRRELSKTRPKNGGIFGQFDAGALRDALKDMEATVTAALAHQPEDEAKCGHFLYDALVKCFNIADMACYAARSESGAEVSRAAATAENSSAVGNAAKLREALSDACYAMFNFLKTQSGGYEEMANALDKAKAALAKPPRNCDGFGGDYKMLHTAWFDWTGSPSGQNPDGTVKLTFAKWLLATATEKKGENNGNK